MHTVGGPARTVCDWDRAAQPSRRQLCPDDAPTAPPISARRTYGAPISARPTWLAGQPATRTRVERLAGWDPLELWRLTSLRLRRSAQHAIHRPGRPRTTPRQ